MLHSPKVQGTNDNKMSKKKYPGPNLERAQGKIIPNPSHFITNNLDIRLPSIFSSLYTYGRWG